MTTLAATVLSALPARGLTAGQRLTSALAAPGIRTQPDNDAGNTWLVIDTAPDATALPGNGQAYLIAYVYEANEDWAFVDAPMEHWAGTWLVLINDGAGREEVLFRSENTGSPEDETAECARFITTLLTTSPR